MAEDKLEQIEESLRELNQNVAPPYGLDLQSDVTADQTEVEQSSTNVQDVGQADLIRSGVDGQIAEQASAVLAEESVEPGNTRSPDEQRAVIEAQIQLSQEAQVAQAQVGQDGFSLENSTDAFLQLNEQASGLQAQSGWSSPGVVQLSQQADRVRDEATQTVGSDSWERALTARQQQQQQTLLDQVVPVIVDRLNAERTTTLQGTIHTAEFDRLTSTLVVVDNATSDPVVNAQWTGAGWSDRGSSLNSYRAALLTEQSQAVSQLQQGQHSSRSGQRQIALE